jgi:hypothetical protein
MTDTANMTAILTDRATQGNVKTILGALQQNYSFCAHRHLMSLVIAAHPHLLDESLFVVDPVDGKPGFVTTRSWILDNLDVDLANVNSSYCHAAMIVKQDLEAEQGKQRHCDKTIVGKRIAIQLFGMPISARYKRNLKALFSKMLNLNTLILARQGAKPSPSCSAVESQIRGEEKSLSIEQLAGVWMVTFGFAALGLVMHYFRPWKKIRVLTRKEREKIKEEKKHAMEEEAMIEAQRRRGEGIDHDGSTVASSHPFPNMVSMEGTELTIPDYVLELSQFSHLFLEEEDYPSDRIKPEPSTSWRKYVGWSARSLVSKQSKV